MTLFEFIERNPWWCAFTLLGCLTIIEAMVAHVAEAFGKRGGK